MKQVNLIIIILIFFKPCSAQTNVLNATGNVGIGNLNPTVLLNIGAGTGALHVLNPGMLLKNAYGDRSIFEIHSPDGENRFVLQSLTYGFYLASLDKKPLLLQTIGGGVTIGTDKPDLNAELTVKGNISSREIKVSASAGADFVFNNDYALPSLKEVERYVKKNKHLPEIASAKEMIENGVEVGKMNLKLLQKIEELTLYLIEKEKQLTSQNDRIKLLEEKMARLSLK